MKMPLGTSPSRKAMDNVAFIVGDNCKTNIYHQKLVKDDRLIHKVINKIDCPLLSAISQVTSLKTVLVSSKSYGKSLLC